MAYKTSGSGTKGVGTSVVITIPATIALNDIFVISIYVESTNAITKPAAATLKSDLTTTAGTRGRNATYWIRATATDVSNAGTGTWTFSWAANVWRESVWGLWSGRVTTGDPFDTISTIENTSASTNVTPTPNPLSTSVAGCDLVGTCTNFTGGSWTPPSGMTERQDPAGNNDITLDSQDNVASGAQTTKTFTCVATSSFMKAFLGALLPAAGGSNFAAAGTVAAVSGVSGAVTANLAASGTVAAVSGLSGAVTSDHVASGTVAAVSGVQGAVSANLTGVSGTVAAVSGALGAVTANLKGMAGIVSAVSGVTGAVTANFPVTGSVAGITNVFGSAAPTGGLAGIVVAVSGVFGSVTSAQGVSGTVAAVSGVTGDAPAQHPITGTVAAVSNVFGAVLPAGGVSGTVGAVTSAFGSVTLNAKISGQVDAVTAVLPGGATADHRGFTGVVAAVSNVFGAAAPANSLQGLVQAVSGAFGSVTARLPASGTVTAVSGAAGSVTMRGFVSGVVAAVSSVFGSVTGAVIPPTPRILGDSIRTPETHGSIEILEASGEVAAPDAHGAVAVLQAEPGPLYDTDTRGHTR